MPAVNKSLNTVSSLPSSQPSLPSQSLLPSLDSLLDELTALTASAKEIEARRQELLDALDQLVQKGEAEEALDWNDFKITRRSRSSYTYPQSITDQREQLKAAEKLAIALGEATQKITTFWEIRQPKA